MAKKSMKIKQARPQKYTTREYNRSKLCGLACFIFIDFLAIVLLLSYD